MKINECKLIGGMNLQHAQHDDAICGNEEDEGEDSETEIPLDDDDDDWQTFHMKPNESILRMTSS